MALLALLQKRGLIDSSTHDIAYVDAYLEQNKPVAVYCGFDPSADSLHMGNFVPIRMLKWFQAHGHRVIALVGGATGMIGDPSGKSKERSLLQREQLEHNTRSITEQLRSLLGDIEVVNNADWYAPMSCIDFLRDIGKYFRIGVMMSKDSVRLRLASEEGMSFTEFAYQVLQGYDFEYLNRTRNVMLQLGGCDQWGNITAGTDCAKKMSGKELFGVTFPLLLKSDGTKFGKSEQGALWLSENKMSSYDLYQQLLRTADADVIRLLLMLTDIDTEIIQKLTLSMQSAEYIPGTAQKLLAETIISFIRGEDGLKKALLATEAAKPGVATMKLSAQEIEALRGQIPEAVLSKEQVCGARLDEMISLAGFLPSKADVRRLIKNKGLIINGRMIEQEFDVLREDDIVDSTWVLISLGKKNRALVVVNV